MKRFFDTRIATEHGTDAAILFEDIRAEVVRSESNSPSGYFNRHPYDHTKWYSLTDKGIAVAAA